PPTFRSGRLQAPLSPGRELAGRRHRDSSGRLLLPPAAGVVLWRVKGESAMGRWRRAVLLSRRSAQDEKPVDPECRGFFLFYFQQLEWEKRLVRQRCYQAPFRSNPLAVKMPLDQPPFIPPIFAGFFRFRLN